MGREELMKMRVVELRKYASSIGVKNSHSFRKADLIGVILEAEKSTQLSNEKDVKAEQKIDNQKEDGAENIGAKGKMSYIKSVPIGTIVAFRAPGVETLKSAKIISRSAESRKLELETAYGKRYIVGYEDIVWARTGLRWPKGIFKMLKGDECCASE